jgi:hypothetical protein
MPATSMFTGEQIMTRTAVILLLLSLIPLALSSGQTWVDSSLSHLEMLYTETQQHKTVQTLAHLDSSVKAFVQAVHKAFPYRTPPQFNPDRYKNLGLWIGHYTDEIGYTEEFLLEAHTLDPNSSLRPLTLYSTILGARSFHGLGEMPNVDSALAYLKEFPRGPYAGAVCVLLGNFYKDLFMVLRDFKEEQKDYKYDCFQPYIDKSPIEAQRSRAQKLALYYYNEALKLDAKDKWLGGFRREVQDGTVSGWSYCAD